MSFYEIPSTKHQQGQTMHICTVNKEKVQFLLTGRNKYVFKRELNDDSDGSHLTPLGDEFQTEGEPMYNERAPSVALLCVGL